MESLQKLKEELQLNKDLTELLDILKGIAVAEYWALEKKRERFAKFMDTFEEFFHLIDFKSVDHPFAKARGNLGIIMITTDEGFMGGLNTRLVNTALEIEGADAADLIVIGERGGGYLRALGRNFTQFPGISVNECYESALNFKNYIMEESLAGKFGRLVLFYPKPITFIAQKIESITILPCYELFKKIGGKVEDTQDVIVESSLHDIIEYLVETWITQKLYEVFEDSKLAEFAARTIHLEESYQLSLQQAQGIRHRYFRTHREFIDKGLRDMFSSQIVKKKEKNKGDSSFLQQIPS